MKISSIEITAVGLRQLGYDIPSCVPDKATTRVTADSENRICLSETDLLNLSFSWDVHFTPEACPERIVLNASIPVQTHPKNSTE